MIKISNLSYSYPTSVNLMFPDISCDSNNPLLIIGNSGTGKTTLLHIMAGILKPVSGRVTINNTDIYQLKNNELDAFRGKNIGIVFQKMHFISSLTVFDNLLLCSWLADKRKKEDKAYELLTSLNIDNQAKKYPQQLSLGQQQRLSIARALMNTPKVILADEPTSSLDDKNCNIVSDLLIQSAQKINAGLIIVTHDNRLKQAINHKIELQ